MKQKIREFLFAQLEMEERGLTACLIIRTMGKDEVGGPTILILFAFEFLYEAIFGLEFLSLLFH